MTDLVRQIEMRIEELHQLVQRLKSPSRGERPDDVLLAQVQRIKQRDGAAA